MKRVERRGYDLVRDGAQSQSQVFSQSQAQPQPQSQSPPQSPPHAPITRGDTLVDIPPSAPAPSGPPSHFGHMGGRFSYEPPTSSVRSGWMKSEEVEPVS